MNMIYMTLSRFTASLLGAALFLLLPGFVSPAQTHEISQENMEAQGWFGGDNRPNSRRTSGVGQLVQIDRSMTINSFAFHFNGAFDYVQNPVGSGHEVTLRLHVRSRSGSILKTAETTLPSTFTAGWVTWDGLTLPAEEGIKLFFTAYLVGGYDVNPFTSSYSASATDPYPDGSVMLKDATSDTELDDWTDWVPNSGWDAAFRLSGTLIATGIADALPQWNPEIRLAQNYPNPVRNHTVFEYTLSRPAAVRLEIYNMLGVKLQTLVDAGLQQGSHRLDWTNNALPTGLYTVVLRAGGNAAVRTLSIVR